jgi:hypothetical protein
VETDVPKDLPKVLLFQAEERGYGKLKNIPTDKLQTKNVARTKIDVSYHTN